ncbi:hypothetical protein CUC15_19650 [Oceanobacillus zhaokaii]|uniref:Uncharacterized protein n=1 Tax=Oceanobacillus zhaokaii TaxID=2052660 RepID=A0A345PLX3_9BACI|nr:hypothetical protein CUC15_19650 [Oceanobacillus zhaokaii]
MKFSICFFEFFYNKRGDLLALKETDKKGEFKLLNHGALAYSLMGIGPFLGMRWINWEGEEVLIKV